MYRQILVDESDRDLQRIIWKSGPFSPIEIFRLRTVTYGTSCAPFLATRTLKALAEDEREVFPRASAVLLTDTYVDDILSGADSLEKTKSLQIELIHLLNRAGMKLHKWVSNHPSLYNDTQNSEYTFLSEINSVKRLGMLWQPILDHLTFKFEPNQEQGITKRDVLSTIARLYDPLGLLGPVIAKAKIFLQKLWSQKLNWTDPIPQNELKEWTHFLNNLPDVSQVKVPRFILISHAHLIDLHGFCDASQHAYGAAVYLCSRNSQGEVKSSLLCSKSRVSPLKTLTIPRLELSAALLLSRLVHKIASVIQLNFRHIYLWSDSTIALAWIKTPPDKLKPFVGNRVKEIQKLCPSVKWKHIPSSKNPADLLSRGSTVVDLLRCPLWWTGPSFLIMDIPGTTDFLDPTNHDIQNELPVQGDSVYLSNDEFLKELKRSKECFLISDLKFNFIEDFLKISNSFIKLCRILSFICRFIYNMKNPRARKLGNITLEELRGASNLMVRSVQFTEFSYEIKKLLKNEEITHSKIRNLCPYLDKNEILRVGGRLQNANLSENAKHPKLLPANHRLTKIIMVYFHKKNLHVGPQTLLHCVRQEFWPVNGRNLARKIVNECIICFKNKPIIANQLLGNLPPERVIPSQPFSNCGIDYCGPFVIKYKGQRKGVFQKIYVAIFICFATKAIHLEHVSDLTSSALIAALKRFFARRGKCSCIFTDNAKNFVGANSELKKLHKLMSSPEENLANYLTSEGIVWKFIPPRSPNFGGLWESGVKSFKHHLRRVVGSIKLTLEEFLTIIIQIESILNSRPIVPLSSDPSELTVLTPGHFLIEKPLNAIPEPNLIIKLDNYLSRWQKITN